LLLTLDGHQRQYTPLTNGDFNAAWTVMKAMSTDYVAFFNCGQPAGCSRLHKHLQLMPMPPGSFAGFLDSKDKEEPQLPFHWFCSRLESEDTAVDNLTEVYNTLLKDATNASQISPEHIDNMPGAAVPHNMIFTRRWMIVIPRRRGKPHKDTGVNALGMLGVIAVATKDELNTWLEMGPTSALREVGIPIN
jgi:ATP adenylyltransferase/5',5'''-P-1,P-4-tetraphosphate phosphorylase II